MKASEFYEKHWLVNGQKPPPLSEEEKQFLDECAEGKSEVTAWFIRKRKRPITINIGWLKAEIAKMPKYFIPANQPKLDKYGQVIPPLMISDKNDDECDARDDDQGGEAG